MVLTAMKILPWRTLQLPTALAPSEAATLFAESVGEGRTFRGERGDELHFEVTRIIDYRNSFLPVIRIAFEPREGGGALVHVRMRLHIAIAIFGAVWMTGATLGGLVSISAGFTKGEPKLAAFGMVFPLAGAAMFCGGFGYEAARAERLLRETFPPPPDPGPPYR